MILNQLNIGDYLARIRISDCPTLSHDVPQRQVVRRWKLARPEQLLELPVVFVVKRLVTYMISERRI